jgi:hypothetical protein
MYDSDNLIKKGSQIFLLRSHKHFIDINISISRVLTFYYTEYNRISNKIIWVFFPRALLCTVRDII